MIRAGVFAVALVGIGVGAAAADERIPERAKQLAERGRLLHEAGDYAGAITAYKDAYVLAPHRALLFNLGQAYRLGGDCDDAAQMYRRFLDAAPDDPERTIALGHLASVDHCAHHPLPVAADALTRTPEAAARRVAPTASADLPGARERRVGAWTIVGGGTALIIAAVFAVDAHQASETIAAAYRVNDRSVDVASLDDHGRRSATLAAVFGAGGGLAVISGAVLYGIGRHRAREARVAAMPQHGGAAVSVTWGF